MREIWTIIYLNFTQINFGGGWLVCTTALFLPPPSKKKILCKYGLAHCSLIVVNPYVRLPSLRCILLCHSAVSGSPQ